MPCKICGHAAHLVGSVDFSKNCEERNGLHLPQAHVPISYHQCGTCGFLFTTAFDEWPAERFVRDIYNDEYVLVDPEYAEQRPASMARVVTRTFGSSIETLSMMDYGSGNGALTEALRTAGARDARAFDPFSHPDETVLHRQYDIVTCFEVLEHDPHPVATIRTLATLTKERGIVVLSTLVQGHDFAREGLNWWYVAPRNGHISVFSRTALATAWQSAGFRVASMDDNVHVAFRTIPEFAPAQWKLWE